MGKATGYPVAFDTGAKLYCAQNCPAGYTAQDLYTCKNGTDGVKKRTAVARNSTAFAKQSTFPVVPKVEVDLVCPPNSTLVQPIDPGVTDAQIGDCYSCPPGQTLQSSDGGWQYCRVATCPAGYSRCGDFWCEWRAGGHARAAPSRPPTPHTPPKLLVLQLRLCPAVQPNPRGRLRGLL